jgi:hypothetical protein
MGQNESLVRAAWQRLDAINKLGKDDLGSEVSRLPTTRSDCPYRLSTASSQRDAQPFMASIKVGEDGLYAFLLVLAQTDP